jgi:outer membrane protein assembly factor BamB
MRNESSVLSVGLLLLLLGSARLIGAGQVLESQGRPEISTVGQGKSAVVAQSLDEKSSDGTMDGVTLQRARVYQTKGVDRLNALIWKTEKIFKLEYLTTEGQFNSLGYSESFSGTYSDFTDPIIANGFLCFKLYAGGSYLVAMDSMTGQGRWKFNIPRVFLSPPAISGELVFVGASDGNLYGLDAGTGQEKWRFNSKDKGLAFASPAVLAGVIYFSSANGILYAVDVKTKQSQWIYRAKGLLTPAAISDNTLYVGTDKGYLYAVDRKTGAEKWNFKAKGELGTPVIANSRIYFRTKDGNLYSIDSQTGQQEWISRIGGSVQMVFPITSVKIGTDLAVAEGTIYFGGAEDLFAIDAKTGELKWKFETKSPCRAPIFADGLVYFGTIGKLYAVDGKTGQMKWEIETSTKTMEGKRKNVSSSPAVADGVIYFLSDDGNFYAIH